MEELIKPSELIQATKLKREGTAKVLMKMLQLNKINEVYSKICDKEGIDFIDALLNLLEIKFEVSDEDLKKLPETGSFMAISNHPYGGIDAVILLRILLSQRPDAKVFGNFLTKRIKPIEKYILPVNPFETHKELKSSYGGIKEAFEHLKQGNALGTFPAGEVSTYNSETKGISDREWHNSAIKFIKRVEVPVIPVHFIGTNSKIFHLLGVIHPLLRTARLPGEMLNKKNKVIKVRIGNPISVKEQARFTDTAQFGRFLRAKTFALGSDLEVKKFFIQQKRFKNSVLEEIIPTVGDQIIENEIEALDSGYFLFNVGDFNVYCAPAISIPNVLKEIGRLREITFRDVGEGTNNSIDIDEYDLYFNHLFIWDAKEKKIVGSYRVGKGADIINQYGKTGFYIQSLFKINKGFIPVLKQSLELGRSFIVKEYQQKPTPLFMLWKGILYFLLKNPEYRYLIGPVSISNRFSNLSKTLIINYVKNNHYDNNMSQYIKSRKKFKVKSKKLDQSIVDETSKGDLNVFDKFIGDIESDNFKLPVLLKKYLKLNGKIIGFNVDPLFNNALDGLLILDLFDVPYNTIQSLSKEFDDTEILKRFQ